MSEKLPDSPTTRKIIADKIGISVSTLKRKIKKAGILLPPGLVYESSLNKIKKLFYPEDDPYKMSGSD